MEQDDCSSCSSIPPLESSNVTEIITIGEEPVPNIPQDEPNMFLIERLLRAVERLRLGQDNGGVHDAVSQQAQDDVGLDIKADRYSFTQAITVALFTCIINIIQSICVN